MIVSFIPGRVRIRNPRFKDSDTASTAATLLREHPCVIRVTTNSTTGGLLIEYDPEKLDPPAAQEALELIDPEALDWFNTRNQAGPDSARESYVPADENSPTASPSSPWPGLAANKEALEYLGMTAAFVLCTGSAFLRSKGLHIYSGISLAGMTLSHIYKYRHRLVCRFKNMKVDESQNPSSRGCQCPE